ncbi:MAG TPA: A/G-specific adenine glycosylase [Chitinophagaceae bacterium]|nr:A/G-specific adenine glycosylase [Chitinophagaceae bacterium]
MKNKKLFTEILLSWNLNENKREMPWKGEKVPYKIWISEIILQQTRVQQGIKYYYRFIKSFPDVKSLANATEQKIFKHWEGLGYYSRCRNIIASAKFITTKLNGKFPEKYEDILALKGIGIYTASAIASFAYNQPYAVVDGNVFRVLSRFFGIEVPVDTSEGKKKYSILAKELLDKKNPGVYNQAIMDFGAIVCKPLRPLCGACPLQIKCIAFKKMKVNSLPLKKKSIKRKERFFSYVIAEYNNTFYVRKRTTKDIWQGLYEFILIDTKQLLTETQLLRMKISDQLFGGDNFIITKVSKTFSQKLTHQTITGKFFHIRLANPLEIDAYSLISREQLELLPFPKFIASYLKD